MKSLSLRDVKVDNVVSTHKQVDWPQNDLIWQILEIPGHQRIGKDQLPFKTVLIRYIDS